MVKLRDFATAMAISALLGVTGCSALGIGGSNEQTAAAQPAPPPAPPPAPAPPPQNVELTRSLVRQVQGVLRDNHLYSGHLDGVWGPKTESGVTQFQQKNNLEATGKIDGPTLQAMNLGNEGASAGMGGNMGAAGSNMNTGTSGGTGAGGSMNTSGGSAGGAAGGAAGTGNGGTTSQ